MPPITFPPGRASWLRRPASSKVDRSNARRRSAWHIARASKRSETWHPVLGGVGLVDVSVDPADYDGLAEARIYSGYSGWAAGQLEMEMAVGSWFGVDATPDDVFDPVPATLWRRVLRRQGGQMARYADYPADPRSN